MKATIDLPDDLYRRVKARAALDGRTVREVSIELYTAWLDPGTSAVKEPITGAEWLARWDELGAETARKAIDPRTTREILLADRR
jgi:plasmid stability protein